MTPEALPQRLFVSGDGLGASGHQGMLKLLGLHSETLTGM